MLAITISCPKDAGAAHRKRRISLCPRTTCALAFLLTAWLWWWSYPAAAQPSTPEQQARISYSAAAARFDTNQNNIAVAWQFGRAAYELADLVPDDHEREKIARSGIDASRRAISLDANSAAAHYYLALNLGEMARARKLSSLRLLHEMEHALLTAAQLDPAFDYGGPDRALGMLYLEAPRWPFSVGNRRKALSHLRTAVGLDPDYPDNHLCLAEAYAQWDEARNLEHELKLLNDILPKARTRYTGANWAANWTDWDARLSKLQETEEHLATSRPGFPSERGARQVR